MHSHIAHRLGKSSSSTSHPPLSTVPPPLHSSEYSTELADLAARILHLSPFKSPNKLPLYILNAAAFPEAKQVDYDALLPYVLSRLPDEEELIGGNGYEVIFFAGTEGGASTGGDSSGHGILHRGKGRPGWGWFVQAYNVLTRATRKRLQALYIVHSRAWVRLLVEMFSTIVSPKFRKKIFHCSSLTSLALYIPIEDLLIPPSAYIQDRKLVKEIHAPYATGRRAFGVRRPFPNSESDPGWRLPRVLRETSSFILLPGNIALEGIFRVPALSTLVDVLCEAYDRGQKFVVWKEPPSTYLPITYPPHPDHPTKPILDPLNIDQEDAYGAYLAAAVLKQWYARLLHPLFPPSTYPNVRSLASSDDDEQLLQFLSPQSEWSTLPLLSRQILTRHLLPLFSLVAARSGDNKMPARNLATCIVPSLLRGPDQLEDAKIITPLSKVLERAIENWEESEKGGGCLRAACNVSPNAFARSLKPPERLEEYEDPLLDENKSLPSATSTGGTASGAAAGGANAGVGGGAEFLETTAQRVGIAPSSSAIPSQSAAALSSEQPLPATDESASPIEPPPALPPRPAAPQAAPPQAHEPVPHTIPTLALPSTSPSASASAPSPVSPVSPVSPISPAFPTRGDSLLPSLSTAAPPPIAPDPTAKPDMSIPAEVRRKPAPGQTTAAALPLQAPTTAPTQLGTSSSGPTTANAVTTSSATDATAAGAPVRAAPPPPTPGASANAAISTVPPAERTSAPAPVHPPSATTSEAAATVPFIPAPAAAAAATAVPASAGENSLNHEQLQVPQQGRVPEVPPPRYSTIFGAAPGVAPALPRR